jgi:hypothetical protein
MFYHLKPWQSWQTIFFHSYDCHGIQSKIHKILSLIFDIKPLKVNIYYVKRNQFCKGLPQELI